MHNTSVPDSGYFYETGEGGTWFEWRNVTEYSTNNTSTFGLQLWPEGSFDFHYANVNVTAHDTWIGFTGDTTSQAGNVYDEVNELFYKTQSGGGMQTSHVTNFTDAETNFGYAWWGQDGGYESGPDCSDPLNDTSCPGYQQAYFDQQCSNDALYDSQCPGYADAYLTQQCASDALYDTQCDGYEVAWLDDQCETDPLFSQSCSGYSAAYQQEQQEQQHTDTSGGYMDGGYDDGSGGFMESQSDGSGGPGGPDDFGGPNDSNDFGGPSGSNDFGGDPGGFTGDDGSDQYSQEPQFTQTEDVFYEPQSFEEPDTYSEPVVEIEVPSEPVERSEPERVSEPETVAQVEEEPFVEEELFVEEESFMEEEPFEEPQERIEERDPIIEDPVEAIEEIEVLVEAPVEEQVEKIMIEKVAVLDNAPVKESSIDRQSNIEIAMSVLETEKTNAENMLSQSVSNSQSGGQDFTDNSSSTTQATMGNVQTGDVAFVDQTSSSNIQLQDVTVADPTLATEVQIQDVAVADITSIQGLAGSNQTDIQIAMSVVGTDTANGNQGTVQPVNDSQTGGQHSDGQSSSDQGSESSQEAGSQANGQYGAQDSNATELYGDDNSGSYDSSGQMPQNSGIFEVTGTGSEVDNAQSMTASVSSDTQQQDDTSTDFEQETFSTTDAMFDTQVNEAFSTGANISVVLSGARPDFSKFDVKPPTKQQEIDTKKVESLAEKMSTTAIQQNIEQIQENVQDSGGFEDQTVAVVLINYVPGFEQYSSQSLKSQNDWYRSKSIYKGSGNVDNTMTLYIMAGQTEQKHKQMVLEQYGR